MPADGGRHGRYAQLARARTEYRPDIVPAQQAIRSSDFAIYESAGSQSLTNIIESHWVRTGPFLHILHRRASSWRGNGIHACILDAVQHRDAQAARLAVHQDIEAAPDYVIKDDIFR